LPSLIDRGTNGSVASNDARVIFKTNCSVDIQGIDNHRCTNIKIGTVGGVIRTHKGPVIGIFNQYTSSTQVLPYTHHVNSNGIKMMLMTNLL
jgi:hypothetical protein